MEAMRQSWTDDRLDDFRGEVNRRFDEVNGRLDRMESRFDQQFTEINSQFHALYRLLSRVGAGIIATLIAGILSLIGIAVF